MKRQYLEMEKVTSKKLSRDGEEQDTKEPGRAGVPLPKPGTRQKESLGNAEKGNQMLDERQGDDRRLRTVRAMDKNL